MTPSNMLSLRLTPVLVSAVMVTAVATAGCGWMGEAASRKAPSRHCVTFELQKADARGIHTRMVIPVRLGGTVRRFELDTGSRHSWVYDDALSDGSEPQKTAQGDSVTLGLTLGEDLMISRQLFRRPPAEDAAVAGTLGMDFLVGRLASINYAKSLLCIYDGSTKPKRLWPRLRLQTAALRDGRLTLTWQVKGQPSRFLFFDTGTGALPFIVTQEAFRALSRIAPENAAIRYPLTARDGPVEIVGAPLADTVSLGDVDADSRYYVFTRGDGGSVSAEWPGGVDGLAGNAMFRGQKVVLDLRGDPPRFGVIPPS